MSASAVLRRGLSALLMMSGLSAMLTLGACSTARQPYTAGEAAVASVGTEDMRTWADHPARTFTDRVDASIRRSAANGGATYLTLSGGGGDGAFGAGLLNGWTQSGRRPQFTLVAGVSTGALMAPFAFLGPDYDAKLTELYTSGIAESLVSAPNLLSGLLGSSFLSSDRLKELVALYITPDILAEVAREHARGRLLIVVTANLDSQRSVIWNMGEIARQGTPQSLKLFRDVLVASASIPAIFPPVLIEATANGRTVEEMHVDGSISGNVFTLPRSYLVGAGGGPVRKGGRLFIVLNSYPIPSFTVTGNKTTDIIVRTVAMGNKEKTLDNLKLTQTAAQRNGIDFNLTYLEEQGSGADEFGFETARMRRLYEIGRERGATGSFWRKTAPDPTETVGAVASR